MSLIAHWTMDNITGSTLTDEQGSYDGTIANMTQTVSGKFDDYLAGGDPTSVIREVDFGGDVPFKSISMWVKRGSLTKSDNFLRKGTTGALLYALATTYFVSIYDGSGVNSTDLTISDTTTWHHVVLVEGTDNNTHWIWVDGVKASAEITSNFAGVFNYLGMPTTTASGWVPGLDNAQVYDTKLTDAEIAILYAATSQDTVIFSTDKLFDYTIAATDIDTTLTDFPAVIVIDNSIGKGNFDATAVFDELGSDWTELIVTDAGMNKLYCEVEKWDDTGEVATLHVKVPSVSSSVDTVLTINYDSTNADNSAYIGVIGSTPGKDVWDSNFVGVWHMSQDPTGGAGCILDSTSNVNHGTPAGTWTAAKLVDGLVGKALDFTGGIYIDVADSASLDTLTGDLTFESFLDADTYENNGILYKGDLADSQGLYRLLAANVVNDWAVSLNDAAITSQGGTPASGWTNITGRYDQVTLDLFEDGVSVSSDAYTAAVTTDNNDLRIGAYYNSSFAFDGRIGEIRISKTDRSSDWIEVTNLSLTDALFTVSGGVLAINNYYEQGYELGPRLAAFYNQLYSDFLSSYYTQWYGDKDILKAHFVQWYKDRGLVNRSWEQVYGDKQALNKYWDLQYAITTTLKGHNVQAYNILQTLNKAFYEQIYGIKNSVFIKNYYASVYGIEADGTYLKQNNSLVIDGVDVDFIIAECEYSQSSYVGTLDVVIPSLPDWLNADFLQSMVFTAGTDVYQFVVTDKNKKETVKGMSLSVTGMSQGITLDFPYADPVLDSFTYGFASDMCIGLAALQGITFTWESPVDWVLSKDDINLTGESPLSGMRQIINSIGSILQSNPDGTMYSTPKDVINTHQYAAAYVDYFLTTGEDFISTETSPDKRSGFNTYSISNIADSSLYVIEIESISDFEKIVKVYQPVWDDTVIELSTSDLSSVTISRLADISNELICDSIEIINGSGVSSKPIYEVREHEYTGRTDLGGITTTEEGVVTCVTAGESILALKYFSRYRQWRVINTDVEQVQFILKTVE